MRLKENGYIYIFMFSPIAAASLGQVYKLRLKEDGSLVGVKVQRPDMHYSVLRYRKTFVFPFVLISES
jgi:ABC1 atypical kinase-like domain